MGDSSWHEKLIVGVATIERIKLRRQSLKITHFSDTRQRPRTSGPNLYGLHNSFSVGHTVFLNGPLSCLVRKERVSHPGKKHILRRGSRQTQQACRSLQIDKNKQVDLRLGQSSTQRVPEAQTRSNLLCRIYCTDEHAWLGGCCVLLAKEALNPTSKIRLHLGRLNVVMPKASSPGGATMQHTLGSLVT